MFVFFFFFFSPEINNHSNGVSYVSQWLEDFITRVKLIFKDKGL